MGIVFDGVRGEVALFGGQNYPYNGGGAPTITYGDTWVWNGTTWTEKHPLAAPSVRGGVAFAFDPSRSESVLFGGYDNDLTNLGGTWIWDGSNWTPRATTRSPSPRSGGTFNHVAASGKLVLVDGTTTDIDTNVAETWLFDGSNWTQSMATSPSPRSSAGAAYDAKHGKLVLFGGSLGPGSTSDSGETFTYAGDQWTRELPTPAPPQRSSAALAYDAERQNTVLFGGYGGPNVSAPTALNDTWTWNGSTWTARSAAGAPFARKLHSLTFDAARREVVMFGGTNSVDVATNETWVWDGSVWTKKSPPTTPGTRYGHAAAYDAARQQVVIFSGLFDGGYLVEGTWTWDGTTWTNRTPARRPLARTRAMMTYHAVRQRLVLFGGDSATGVLGDTWTWDGSTWTDVTSPIAPTARATGMMVYDSERNRALLFGGRGRLSDTNDSWVWDGGWAILSTGEAPAVRSRHAMAFDVARKQVVMFGGSGGDLIRYGDTWLTATAGGGCTTQDDCLNGFCTNGVCCNVASCGTCATCAGTSPGRCTAVTNTEEPTTCAIASSKTCDANGSCKIALGMAASAASDCASGFLSDGVCCNERCDGTCQACRADTKQTGDRSGTCGPAKEGLDPHDSCQTDPKTECKHDGACDGRGACRLYKSGTACGDVTCVGNRATGAVCDGLGLCGVRPAGIDCVAYACTNSLGCSSTCTTNAECGPFHHCESGLCAADRGATCDGDHVLVSATGDRTECGYYKCAGASCLLACTNRNDCAQNADCTPEHTCRLFEAPAPPDGGCAQSPRSGTNESNLLSSLVCGFLVAAIAARSGSRSRSILSRRSRATAPFARRRATSTRS